MNKRGKIKLTVTCFYCSGHLRWVETFSPFNNTSPVHFSLYSLSFNSEISIFLALEFSLEPSQRPTSSRVIMIDQKYDIYGSNIAFLSSYLSRVFSVERYSSILPALGNKQRFLG